MRSPDIARGLGILALGSALVGWGWAQDEPSKSGAGTKHWKDAASTYRISLDSSPPTALSLREDPALKWTNPQRRTDDGAVFVWTDRGRPEVAASFYRYKSDDKSIEDHEFVSLSASPLSARRDGDLIWSVAEGNVRPTPIPDAPKPAATPVERLRQMRALAREFRASFNNPPDLSEIRMLTQPIYRFETEGKRTDILDGALFAFVHTTDPEVLLTIEARPEAAGGPPTWHYSIARMSLVNLRAHHKDREVWSAQWVQPKGAQTKPYMVRTIPAGR
jgi:hypothetical protein